MKKILTILLLLSFTAFAQQRPKGKHFSLEPVLDTNIHASGDQLGTFASMTFVTSIPGRGTTLKSVSVLDKGSVDQAFHILLFNSGTAVSGTNQPLDISDVDMEGFVGRVSVANSDFTHTESNSMAMKEGLNLKINSGADRDLYMILHSGAAGTYAADGLLLKLYFEED